MIRVPGLLAGLLVLSACGGGGAVGTAPTVSGAGVSDGSRSTEATTPQYIYIAHASDVAVYHTAGTGSVRPVRIIKGVATGLSYVQGISVDQNGRLYVAVATGGVTVLEFKAGANGNVKPDRILHSGDPPKISGSYAGSVAVRYDGTVAVGVGGQLNSGQPEGHGYVNQALGIFSLDGTFTPEFTLGYGVPRSATVDGSGDVLFSFFPELYGIRPAYGTRIDRLSPHPDGYYDDGIVYSDSDGVTARTIAASGDDDLQLGATRMTGSLAKPIAAVVTLGGGITDQSPIAFDTAGKLFAIGGSTSGDLVLVYPRAVHAGQLPNRSFQGQTSEQPVGIAVGP